MGFSFPFVYSGCHQIASFIGVNVIFKVKPKLNTLSKAQWRAKWPALLGLSVMMVLNIGCNNASLVYVGLSINQIIKSITPLPTMILSYVTEKKRYSWTLVGIVLLQVCLRPASCEDRAHRPLLLCYSACSTVGVHRITGDWRHRRCAMA